MKRVSVIALIVSILFAVAANAQTRQPRSSPPKTAAPKQSADVQDLYQKARDAEAKRNYAEAAAQYEQILTADPTIHALRANLGLMRYLNGEYDAAVREFRQALAGDGSLQTAHLFLGVTLIELNQPAEALPHLETAVRNKPQDLNARFQLARAYYLADRHPQALKELQFLIDKQPDDPEALFLLGRVHLKLSLAAYDRLKEKHPDNYRIYQLLGENYAVQSLYGPAIANYRKAIERNPQGRGLRLKLGEIHQSAGEPDKALEAFAGELQLNPNDAYAHYKVGAVLLDQNKSDQALPHLKRSVELDPRAGEPRASYGRCLLELNQPQEAIAQLLLAVKLDASNAAAWFQLARAYQKTGDSAAAEQALKMYEKLKDKT
jgi:tetratricopeptide (TPR) repeat protein